MCTAFRKTCQAADVSTWHLSWMTGKPSASFDALRPAIKKRWETLLRTAPVGPPATRPLVTSEMLIFMLDDTLARLGAKLGEPAASDRAIRDLLPYGPRRAGCQCGLHLLLTYCLTGAQALKEALPVDSGRWRVEVLHGFNRLAHDEMAALCGICRHRGGPNCGLRPEKTAAAQASPPAAAVSPATPSATARSRAGTPG